MEQVELFMKSKCQSSYNYQNWKSLREKSVVTFFKLYYN